MAYRFVMNPESASAPAPLEARQLSRVAVLRCCGAGDVAQMTPLLQQIRADAPQARLEVILNANVAGLLEGAPGVDAVHALPAADFRAGRRNAGLWRLWRGVRALGRYDALFYLDLGWSRTVLAALARADFKAGFRTGTGRPWGMLDLAMDLPVAYPENATHASEWYLRLWLAATGGADGGYAADLGHLRDAENPRLPRHVALVPRAGNELVPGGVKEWPRANWAELAAHLLEQGWTPVVLGRAGDLDMGRMPAGTLDMQGRTTLAQAAAWLSRCGGVVGNDSGLFHLALAVGTPGVGLFGPTAVERTGPFRAPHGRALQAALACVPCCADGCHVAAQGREESARPFCLSALAPARVAAEAVAHFTQMAR